MNHRSRAILTAATLGIIAGAAHAERIFGVTANQTLVSFNASTPNAIDSGVFLQGLAANEQILGIDFRPADGRLYALGSFSNLYSIDTATGAATRVGSGFAPALNGSQFGFDFNPTIDRIRVVSEADQNLVLNPDTGGATQVTPLFYAADDMNAGMNPNIVGSAYTNSFFGATTSQLYGIDTGLDVLVTQANSAGTLRTVGSLGVDLGDTVGFDISGLSGIAYASVVSNDLSRSTFWTIDLATGQATALGEIGGGALITAIAVVPSPGALAGLGLAGATLAARRRRD